MASMSRRSTVSVLDEIPLVDLSIQHAQIRGRVSEGWASVADRAAFVLGKEVQQFEDSYSEFIGVRHCVGVASGTDALELALRALRIGSGDEVIVPTNSFVASAAAVARSGAKPVLVDVDPEYLLIDPEQVVASLTRNTRAVIGVHLFGQMSPLDDLREMLDDRVLLIEDAAQAHGARRHGQGEGSFGVAAATSFYPGKNLGAYGDAGAVLTNDEEVANLVRALRDHGSHAKYQHSEIGFNSRLDTLQAVVLAAKLPYLRGWNESRREAANLYDDLLQDHPLIVLPQVSVGNEPVWHLYVIRVPDRDAVIQRLHDIGIGAGVHYPIPIHLQGAFRYLGYEAGDFPIAERACQEILSLPIFPGITPEQQERVVRELRRAIT
jgi:dTDP-4-amino-4,6-dideoxygalactose transaminase